MNPSVIHMPESASFDTRERCSILELSNVPEDPDVSIARAVVKPGVVTAWHRLDGIAERYVLLAGTGRVEVEGMPPAEVGPGCVVHIPPGSAQRITNTSDDVLVFLAICTPRFRPEAYSALSR